MLKTEYSTTENFPAFKGPKIKVGQDKLTNRQENAGMFSGSDKFYIKKNTAGQGIESYVRE